MSDKNDSVSTASERTDAGISRRRVLQLSGGAAGIVTASSVPAAAGDPGDDSDPWCDQRTIKPEMVHYDDSIHEVCADDHPRSTELQEAVRAAFEESYPTVGSLLDAGFIPYWDFFASDDWSHWLSPAFVGDDTVLDAERPESVLVDHTYWRPIGVMYVATRNGEGIHPPPTIYERDDGDGGCQPWHTHVGLPGRHAWWIYQKSDRLFVDFPCRTPWMLHVWRYDHETSVYAHDAPSDRGGPPAEPPGFETDADPDKEPLGPEHLPDAVLDRVPDRWKPSSGLGLGSPW